MQNLSSNSMEVVPGGGPARRQGTRPHSQNMPAHRTAVSGKRRCLTGTVGCCGRYVGNGEDPLNGAEEELSKLNQIQQALLALGGAEFQKLGDAYLHAKGVGRVTSLGSVVGANKVKAGTPDALIAGSDGTYVLTEYTTQQTNLPAKLHSDLDKCLDEGKTGIPLTKLSHIVFCFAGQLGASDEISLASAANDAGVPLELIGIDTLAFDLLSKYPGLANEFLGVPIDSGQIVTPDRFVAQYGNQRFATRLDLPFHFRQEELDDLLEAPRQSERWYSWWVRQESARPGVALEACRRFEESNGGFEVSCVYGRNRDLWEDLQVRFSKPGKFLILVDDANRVSQFEYIVDLFAQRLGPSRSSRWWQTVRDYARRQIERDLYPLGGYQFDQVGSPCQRPDPGTRAAGVWYRQRPLPRSNRKGVRGERSFGGDGSGNREGGLNSIASPT